jgi:hypothetical protein
MFWRHTFLYLLGSSLEAACSSETSLSAFKTTACHNLEGHNLKLNDVSFVNIKIDFISYKPFVHDSKDTV